MFGKFLHLEADPHLGKNAEKYTDKDPPVPIGCFRIQPVGSYPRFAKLTLVPAMCNQAEVRRGADVDQWVPTVHFRFPASSSNYSKAKNKGCPSKGGPNASFPKTGDNVILDHHLPRTTLSAHRRPFGENKWMAKANGWHQTNLNHQRHPFPFPNQKPMALTAPTAPTASPPRRRHHGVERQGRHLHRAASGSVGRGGAGVAPLVGRAGQGAAERHGGEERQGLRVSQMSLTLARL